LAAAPRLDTTATQFVLGKSTKPGGSGTGMATVIQALMAMRGGLSIKSQSERTSSIIRMPN
jgi:nitrogen-specific signal transduction histidine kinase